MPSFSRANIGLSVDQNFPVDLDHFDDAQAGARRWLDTLDKAFDSCAIADMTRHLGMGMARTPSSRKPAPPTRKGPVQRLLALLRRFPVQASLALVATLIGVAAGILDLVDRWTAGTHHSTVEVNLVDRELAPLSNGTITVTNTGERVFTKGLRTRAQLVLSGESGSATINAVSIERINAVPPAVVQAIKTDSTGATEPYSWAGARTVRTYYAILKDGVLRVAYNGEDGKMVSCPPDNLLDCGGTSSVLELNTGEATYAIDLQLGYQGTAPQGIAISIDYVLGGNENVARSETLYLAN